MFSLLEEYEYKKWYCPKHDEFFIIVQDNSTIFNSWNNFSGNEKFLCSSGSVSVNMTKKTAVNVLHCENRLFPGKLWFVVHCVWDRYFLFRRKIQIFKNKILDVKFLNKVCEEFQRSLTQVLKWQDTGTCICVLKCGKNFF